MGGRDVELESKSNLGGDDNWMDDPLVWDDVAVKAGETDADEQFE